MKAARSILFCFVVSGALAVESAAMSDRLKAVMRTTLPAYSPASAGSAGTTGQAGDPDALQLPKMTVREKRLPKMDPELWRSEKDIQQQAMREYRDSMTPLEWALNSWFVPIFGTPPSARARAAYQEKKLTEQLRVFDRLSEVDKMNGTTSDGSSKKAVSDMQRADDWQSRPAGSK